MVGETCQEAAYVHVLLGAPGWGALKIHKHVTVIVVKLVSFFEGD